MNAVASVRQSIHVTGDEGGRFTAAEGYAEALATAGIRSANDLFNLDGGQSLDKPNLPGWRQRLRIDLPGIGRCYLKRYAAPPIGVQLRRLFSTRFAASAARIEWQQIERLQNAGIATVTPLALGERMVGPIEKQSAFLTAELPGQSLETYAADRTTRISRSWVRQLAELIRRFHAAGLVHRDLYLCHVFVDELAGNPSFHLIDLARVFRPRLRRRRWIVKDLASLNYSAPDNCVSDTDRIRFLRAYVNASKLRPEDRQLIRQVTAKTNRIARHDARLQADKGNAA